jgi:hypothetical protein
MSASKFRRGQGVLHKRRSNERNRADLPRFINVDLVLAFFDRRRDLDDMAEDVHIQEGPFEFTVTALVRVRPQSGDRCSAFVRHCGYYDYCR